MVYDFFFNLKKVYIKYMGLCFCNIIFLKFFKKRKNYIIILEFCLSYCRLLMVVFIDVNYDSAFLVKEEIVRFRFEKDGNI